MEGKELTTIQEPVRYGKPEINELFDFWAEATGIAIQSQVQKNRFCANTMLKKHGLDGVKKLIRIAAIAQTQDYAPIISDFVSLQSKTNALLVWAKRKQMSPPKVVKIQ